MEKTKTQRLTFTVTTVQKEQGGQTCSVDYDPDDLKPLCMALITDPYMSQVAKAATAFLLATSADPAGFINDLQKEAGRMTEEMTQDGQDKAKTDNKQTT